VTAARRSRLLGYAGLTAVAVVTALYFFQSSTLAPNQTDEGLILQYIEAMAHGELPFYDFVDAYGLLNWVFPVAFFKAFGDRVWGVRMWMIVVKVITVLACVLLVGGLTGAASKDAPADTPRPPRGRFYTTLAALFTTILLGAQWQSLQTAYAFITVMPLVLFTWYFVLCAPLENPRANVWVAAAFTTAAIWTKLNTGMFLFAAGLFAYFFWIPVAFHDADEDGSTEVADDAKTRLWLGRARLAGALAYGLLFSFFVRKHFSQWFFLYLVLPLFMSLGWAVQHMTKADEVTAAPVRHVAPFRAYFLTVGTSSLAILFAYYGKHAGAYARELAGILGAIHYTAPFPPLGKPGTYIGLNEYYWLQLPWLVTAVFALWLGFGHRMGPLVYGAEWPARRAKVSALFAFTTLHSFVMYARSDETHIYQALVLVVPALFVVLADLDRFLCAPSPRARFPLRLLVGGLAFLYSLTLAVLPTAEAFQLGRGDWSNPKLDHLKYRRLASPYTREFSPGLKDRQWDEADDQTAAYVKSLSLPGEEMLLLTANRLVYFNSNTHPIGGRYHFYFYLASVGLLDREGFDKLVPRRVIQDIIDRPPRVIVGAMGWVPLAVMFPELRWLRDTRYEHTRHFQHIFVHELRVDGRPVPEPLR
jgi:hypothetical protein